MSADQDVYFLLQISILITECTVLRCTALHCTAPYCPHRHLHRQVCVCVCVCVCTKTGNPQHREARQCILIETVDTNSATPVCARSLTPTRTHMYAHRSPYADMTCIHGNQSQREFRDIDMRLMRCGYSE